MDEKLMQILRELVAMDPEGTVDYDPGYSEYTPGGPITGCFFCYHIPRGKNEDWAVHKAGCLWNRAKELIK